MIQIRFVTVEGCKAPCRHCARAEVLLHSVASLAGVPLPEHEPGSRGEAHLGDGRSLEAIHMDCDKAKARGFPIEGAPYLAVGDDIILQGDDWDDAVMAREILALLRPGGLADLRP